MGDRFDNLTDSMVALTERDTDAERGKITMYQSHIAVFAKLCAAARESSDEQIRAAVAECERILFRS